MNKQELCDALASRGLDTNGLRPLLIQRLESSSKASVTAAGAVETILANNETLTLTSQKETLTLTPQNETLSLTLPKETLPRKWHEESLTLNQQKEILTLKLQEDVTDENAEFKDTRECETVSRAVTGNEAPADANLKASSPKSDGTRAEVAPLSGAEIGKRNLNGGNGSTTGSLSDLDKKRRRAERFGVGLQVSEEEKLALRAERFSGVQGKKKASVQEPESEKRKQRAERFGIVDEATIRARFKTR